MKHKQQPHKPVVMFEMTIVANLDTAQTEYGVLTVYEDGTALFSITMPSGHWTSHVKGLVEFAWRAYNDVGTGQLQLPDMGDYQIQYFSTG